MQSILLQNPRSARHGARASTLRRVVKDVAVILLFAAIAGGSIHFLNLVLDVTLPDPLHWSAGAAAPAATSRASAAKPASAPANFAAQFPPPTGPVEPQPEAF